MLGVLNPTGKLLHYELLCESITVATDVTSIRLNFSPSTYVEKANTA